MKIAEKILKQLDEKLLLVNNNKQNGNAVFLAGGAASGKSFAANLFMDIKSYKRFDVDELKASLIKLSKLGKIDKSLANLDLRNPNDVFKLHQYVKDKGLDDKVLNNFLNNIRRDKGLPNILFDITFKDFSNFKEKADRLLEVGYTPENLHLVWVLSDYNVSVENNAKRSRVVPQDIVFATHTGAAKTMADVLSGNIPKELQGEVYVVLSDSKLSTFQDASGKVTKFSDVEKIPSRGVEITDFPYIKVKDIGKKIDSNAVNNKVFNWAKTRVPEEVRKLFV